MLFPFSLFAFFCFLPFFLSFCVSLSPPKKKRSIFFSLDENLVFCASLLQKEEENETKTFFLIKSLIHTHTHVIINMSAALTSSTFVGAKVSVAKTTTVSKRAAFSVQANASGPKRVRIPISFFFSFFVRLKSSTSRPMRK